MIARYFFVVRIVDAGTDRVKSVLKEMENFHPIGSSILTKPGVGSSILTKPGVSSSILTKPYKTRDRFLYTH